MNRKKVTAILAARMSSSRLPKKTLFSLNGKPMLEHIINFLKFCENIDQIIVATSIEKEDNEIEKFCLSKGCLCFRGSKENVLSRYYECAKKYNSDFIVRLTADNPLVNPTLIDESIDMIKKKGFDYVTNMIHPTFPLGAYPVEIMTFRVLKENFNEYQDKFNRENVTYYRREFHKKYKVGEISASQNLNRQEWRLTVDYEEDFKLMEKIFEELYNESTYIKYTEIVKFLDNNQDLLKINEKHTPNQYPY